MNDVQSQLASLDTKFHECFEEVPDDAADILRTELSVARRQVVHNGNTANDNYDAIRCEFEGFKEELRSIYIDMDELEAEVRKAWEGAAAEHEAANTAFHNDILEKLRRLESLVKYVDGRLDIQEDSCEKVVGWFVERTRQLQVDIRALAEQGDAVLCRLSEESQKYKINVKRQKRRETQ